MSGVYSYFLFRKKTAYERRMSEWSSDVCSSDLAGGTAWVVQSLLLRACGAFGWAVAALLAWSAIAQRSLFDPVRAVADALDGESLPAARPAVGSAEGRRVGEEWVSTFKFRGARYPDKQNKIMAWQ